MASSLVIFALLSEAISLVPEYLMVRFCVNIFLLSQSKEQDSTDLSSAFLNKVVNLMLAIT